MNKETASFTGADSNAVADATRNTRAAGPRPTARLAAIGMTAAGILAGGAHAQDAGSSPGTDGSKPTVPPRAGAVTSLPPIEVTGTATVLPHDIPQSIDTVSQQEISEQGISSLQDVLRNVPGITLNAGEGGAHGDSVNLRGISVPDSFFLDGLRDIGLRRGQTTFPDQSVQYDLWRGGHEPGGDFRAG